MKLLQMLWGSDEGQDLTEYALVVVFVALASTAAMTGLATALSTAFDRAASTIAT